MEGRPEADAGRWDRGCFFGGQGFIIVWPLRAVLRGADEIGGFGPEVPSLLKGTAQVEGQLSRLLPRKHLSSCWLATQLLGGS